MAPVRLVKIYQSSQNISRQGDDADVLRPLVVSDVCEQEKCILGRTALLD